jgi:hypothetical protein
LAVFHPEARGRCYCARRSSQNSITRAIFVKKVVKGATPEVVAEVEELAAALRDYYKPESIVEEILLQEIAIETARYGRVLALEQPEPGATRGYLLHCLDKIMRYTTSTSRALSQAIKALETIQAARKASEGSAASMDAEPAKLLNQRGATRGGSVENPASSDSRVFEDPEDGVAKSSTRARS